MVPFTAPTKKKHQKILTTPADQKLWNVVGIFWEERVTFARPVTTQGSGTQTQHESRDCDDDDDGDGRHDVGYSISIQVFSVLKQILCQFGMVKSYHQWHSCLTNGSSVFLQWLL